jgi:DNA polymerase-1
MLWCAGQDVYGAERRKAKTLNFSIAYGKTAIGLSKDWGVSVEARHSD